MQSQHGLSLLVLLSLAFLGYDIGRHVLVNQDVPAFFVENVPGLQIALEGDWPGSGIHQISDVMSLLDVIKMTELEISAELALELNGGEPLQNGERLVLQLVDGGLAGYVRGWMPAAQRVVLGIPLHPDLMSEKDWNYLPGIGSRLGAAIVADRQKNGDFVRLESLSRVKGVGSRRVKSWEAFF